ncbi:MAG: ketoacyl-ACP synthase III [Candidatus Amulumruptor caecigallinarius]|nr:ketoacyl-ACP synthase III [Candidatus Amulumruptor caecigallinarius]MCM1397617.1 ketoacyl-ACP synthase III [Candidatus Amulumruptor caecigallinarius]MCM1454600.1 ketoacyl-ACP synthase III [bacterium]
MMAYIKAISYYLPERSVTNSEIVADFPEWTVEKIAEKVGVDCRHVASADETAADMAVKAAEKLFDARPEIKRDDIDFVLFCTQSPDYLLPTSACLIQNRLGLRTDIGALDFNLGCSGYVYGLALAKGMIAAGIATNVLLLTGETYNRHLHPRDKGNRTIFGDAATATVVSTEGMLAIGEFSLGTDGRGAENLIIKTGGARHPQPKGDLEYDENGNPHSSDYLQMNGAEIFRFTQKNVPVVVRDTLARNGLTLDEIDLTVFHQANSFMLGFLRKKMKIDSDKFYVNMASVGNTVSNSIPIALCDAMAEGRVRGNVLICGFGVGYSWGATVLRAE